MVQGKRGFFRRSRVVTNRLPGRGLFLAGALASAALAGCAGDTNPVRDVFVATGVGAERKKAPEFVDKSRPTNVDYTPVGVAAPKRAVTAKPKAGVAAAEAEMDAVRGANETKAKEAKAVGAAVQPLQRPVVPPPVQ
jgi:hypothetical protein